jgi:hypothetical protein
MVKETLGCCRAHAAHVSPHTMKPYELTWAGPVLLFFSTTWRFLFSVVRKSTKIWRCLLPLSAPIDDFRLLFPINLVTAHSLPLSERKLVDWPNSDLHLQSFPDLFCHRHPPPAHVGFFHTTWTSLPLVRNPLPFSLWSMFHTHWFLFRQVRTTINSKLHTREGTPSFLSIHLFNRQILPPRFLHNACGCRWCWCYDSTFQIFSYLLMFANLCFYYRPGFIADVKPRNLKFVSVCLDTSCPPHREFPSKKSVNLCVFDFFRKPVLIPDF